MSAVLHFFLAPVDVLHGLLSHFQFVKLYILFCGFMRSLLVPVVLAVCDMLSQEPGLVRASITHSEFMLALLVGVKVYIHKIK